MSSRVILSSEPARMRLHLTQIEEQQAVDHPYPLSAVSEASEKPIKIRVDFFHCVGS